MICRPALIAAVGLLACTDTRPVAKPLRAAEEWRIERVRRVGEAAGRAELELHRPQRPMFVADDVVAFAQNYGEVMFFRTDGGFIKSFGKRGGGPQEFRQLFGLYRLADSLIAMDAARNRAIVLTGTGEFVRSLSISGPIDAQAGVAVLGPGELATLGYTMSQATTRTTVVRVKMPLVLQRNGEESVLRQVDGPTHIRTGSIWIFQSLTDMSRITAWREQIALIEPDSAALVLIEKNGAVRSISLPTAKRAVTDATIRALKIEAEREARRAGIPGEGTLPRYELYPTTLPHWGRIFTDAVDCIWIRRFWSPEDTEFEWLIVDPTNDHLATLRVPRETNLGDMRNDLVAGIERDQLDVQYLAFYRIQRPPRSTMCRGAR